MKKKYYLLNSLILMLSILCGCSKEELTSTLSKKRPESISQGIGILSARDGVYDLLGYGYNALGEYGNSNAATFKVVNVEALDNDYTDRVEEDLSTLQDGFVITGEDAASYARGLSTRVVATAGIPLFKATLKASYSDSSYSDSKYVYASYFLKIKQKTLKFNSSVDFLKNYLTPEFVLDVQNESPFYIVSHYGTHVLSDIILGAKLEILYRAETTNSNRTTAASIGLDLSVGQKFSLNTGLGYNSGSTSHNFNQQIHYKTYGGNPSISLIGTLSLDNSPPAVNISNWQSSSNVGNAELIDIGANGLIPIYELVSDPSKKAALKAYVDQYLINGQVVNNYMSQLVGINSFAAKNGGHHYLSTGMVDDWNYWNYLGISFRAYNRQIPGTAPINVFFSSQGKDHLYTIVVGK